ncbi:MAG: response regulator [Clostridia bacterium]|nr:response regulator [Clostridia bacterium]
MDDKKIKVVVADGDSLFADTVRAGLCKFDLYDVKVISDFSCFSEFICSERPDVIVMDIILPGIDGLYFIKKSAELFNGAFSPEIIIVSAFYNERYIKDSSLMGVYSYFIKPVSLNVLLDAVRDASEQKHKKVLPSYMAFGKSNISIVEEPVMFASSDSPKPLQDSAQSQRRLIVKITQLLHDMGIPAHLCGHDYLRDAIMMVMDSHEISGRMTKEIYPEIANKYKKSPQSVERAIRTALDVAWTRGKTELINEIFRFTVNIQKGRPTNSEFVSLIADYLNYECMNAV